MRKSGRGPTREQIRAWLYHVLNPVIEALRQELTFLVQQKNPTWRFKSRRCEFVRLAAEYVDHRQHPNLEQLGRYRPEVGRTLNHHDSLVVSLEAKAAAAHAALLQLAELRGIASRLEADFPQWRGAFALEDGPAVLAENIVNYAHVSGLPSHYSNAEAWNRIGSEALRLRAHGVVVLLFKQLDDAQARLTEASTESLLVAQRARDVLADQHGLPAAPMPMRSTDEPMETP